MENVAFVFWVLLFVSVPAIALFLARRHGMKRKAQAPHDHRRPRH